MINVHMEILRGSVLYAEKVFSRAVILDWNARP